jgi:hypothetical protein
MEGKKRKRAKGGGGIFDKPVCCDCDTPNEQSNPQKRGFAEGTRKCGRGLISGVFCHLKEEEGSS